MKLPRWAIILICVAGALLSCTIVFCATAVALSLLPRGATTAQAISDISFSRNFTMDGDTVVLEQPTTTSFHAQDWFVYRVSFSHPVDDREISYRVTSSGRSFDWQDPPESNIVGSRSTLLNVQLNLWSSFPDTAATYTFHVLQNGNEIGSKDFTYSPT
jgi:hypothetical protein